ncbi:MAG TPA: right-handed parallel beta-helix repeat-containing protein [Anaerolineales bacterium]|nr:right-handed parallel beta-helix repeat-containing protein [Anaerolineales bacterium]
MNGTAKKNFKTTVIIISMGILAFFSTTPVVFAQTATLTKPDIQWMKNAADDAREWFVSISGDDADDCFTPGTPCATVNGVFVKPGFQDGDIIKVAKGTYTKNEAGTLVVIDNDVTIIGGWNEEFTAQDGDTIFDGEETRPGIWIGYGIEVIIDTFIVENSKGSGVGGRGTTTLKNCEIRNNTILNGSGAGVVVDISGQFTIMNCEIHSNTAMYNGGGIAVYNGDFTLIDSKVYDNHTLHTYPGLARGGGVYIKTYGSVSILGSEIYGNYSPTYGGGIYIINELSNSYSEVTIVDSSIYNNMGDGGGIHGHSVLLDISSSSIYNNTSLDDGGGIYLRSGTLVLSNSTLSGNHASGNGSGFFALSTMMPIELNNSTIAFNFGDGFSLSSLASPLRMKNSILANNFGYDCEGEIVSDGYNLIGNTSGCTFVANTGDQVNVDPLLLPLENYSGHTLTHALLGNSLAVDAGDPAAPGSEEACVAVDQRNISRPFDGDGDGNSICDIGAFELFGEVGAPEYFFVEESDLSGWVNNSFSQLFKAMVIDQIGNGVPGILVTFSAPEDGPSGTFSDSATHETTVPTDEFGVAEAPEFVANNEIGSYEIIVSALEFPEEISIPVVNKEHLPDLTILNPVMFQNYIVGDTINFIGIASDEEDGNLSSTIVWKSSIDGVIGVGGSVSSSSLSIGGHTIFASVNDSHGQTTEESILIWVESTRPEVSILSPSENDVFYAGSEILFIGSALDLEDGDISESIIWNSSRDGVIGVGESFSMAHLSVGKHKITASVSDKHDMVGEAHIEIEIMLDSTPPTAEFISPTLDGIVQWPRTFLTVTASDDQCGVASVTFSAYYEGSWHELFVDTQPANGWRYLWSTVSLEDEFVSLRAVVIDHSGNQTLIELPNLLVTSTISLGNGAESRGNRLEVVISGICAVAVPSEWSEAVLSAVQVERHLPNFASSMPEIE